MADIELTAVSNVTGTPVSMNKPSITAGRVRTANGVYGAAGGAPSNGDIVYYFGLPSAAVLLSLRKFHTQIASGVAEVGLFTYDGDGTYTAVDADLFASALDISTAVDITGTEIMHESGVVTVNERGTALWEMAGASSDPNTTYYVGVTLTTAGTWSSDYLALTALYVID